jgi:hypothetical protein
MPTSVSSKFYCVYSTNILYNEPRFLRNPIFHFDLPWQQGYFIPLRQLKLNLGYPFLWEMTPCHWLICFQSFDTTVGLKWPQLHRCAHLKNWKLLENFCVNALHKVKSISVIFETKKSVNITFFRILFVQVADMKPGKQENAKWPSLKTFAWGKKKREVNQELRFDQMFQKGANICDLLDGPIRTHSLYFSLWIRRTVWDSAKP